jgi:hypothetical protein
MSVFYAIFASLRARFQRKKVAAPVPVPVPAPVAKEAVPPAPTTVLNPCGPFEVAELLSFAPAARGDNVNPVEVSRKL